MLSQGFANLTLYTDWTMESIFQDLAKVIEAVGDSPVSLTALIFVVLAVLASLLFKTSKELSRLFVFIALVAFAVFVVVVFSKTLTFQSSSPEVINPTEPLSSSTVIEKAPDLLNPSEAEGASTEENALRPRPPRTGNYFAQGTINRGSSRMVATVQDQSCIAVVQGIASPYQGNATITVSKLLWRDGAFRIGPGGNEFVFSEDGSSSENSSSRVVWYFDNAQIVEPYKSFLNECLMSDDDNFEIRRLGDFMDGIPFPDS